jgi:hypothetical protein
MLTGAGIGTYRRARMIDQSIEVNERFLDDLIRSRVNLGRRYNLEKADRIIYEYSRRTHASSYARVVFVCSPSEKISCSFNPGVWPSNLTESEVGRLKISIARAASSLLLLDFYPHIAALHLEEIGWDDVRSSEVAVYRATIGAMRNLQETAGWILSS